MGSSQSSLVKPGEIPAFVQRNDWGKLAGVGIFLEPARFNEPKPYELYRLSDDNWAALALRVDPLARYILDPHRSYIGAIFLCLVMTSVFSAVRPRLNERSMDSYNDDTYFEVADDQKVIDDFYLYPGDDFYDGIDDVSVAEKRYREEEINHKLFFWTMGYLSILAVLIVSTAGLAVGMERRNAKFDDKIRGVCSEMRPRFESEGFTIEYRTRKEKGIIGGYMRPERIIVFKRIDADSSERYRAPPRGGDTSSQCTSNISAVSVTNSPYSTFMVQVPEGSLPGEVLQVSTPSGKSIMVSVPLGVRPGQQFPVLIPPRFQQQLASTPHSQV